MRMKHHEEKLVPRTWVPGLDASVSRLGLGTVKFGRTEGLRYPGTPRLPTDLELQNLLCISRNAGIDLIDTAPSYGVSEERLGLLLKNDRPYWKIVGKAGEKFSNGRTAFDLRPKSIVASLEQSLGRLKTDYLDVFLVHYTTAVSDFLSDDLIDTLRRLKERGLVCLTGASTHSTVGAEMALNSLDTILHPMSEHSNENLQLLSKSKALGRSIFVKKGLNCGYAADPEASIRNIIQLDGVTSLIVGTTSPNHLRANITAAAGAV